MSLYNKLPEDNTLFCDKVSGYKSNRVIVYLNLLIGYKM